MPFGLKNAGATFVRAVRFMLRRIRDFADSYVDDIGVGSQNWETHLHHIHQFLNIVREAGMTLNLAKCEFGKPEVKFVGRLVGSGNYRPDSKRLQGLDKIEVPSTKKKLRALLGAFGYYKDYIPHFSAIAMPLTDLTKKDVAAFDVPSPKTPYRRKNLAKISYASRVIANFVSNFVDITKGVMNSTKKSDFSIKI